MADHHPASEHVHGTMDITEHEKMFAGFMKFWVYLFGGAIGILIFLALFNS
jgi:hypothetical protein